MQIKGASKRKQVEMRRDIDDLVVLSKKLKDQREQFVKEKNRFISFIKKQKGCENCGAGTSEFFLSDLQSLQEIENEEVLPLSRIADSYVKVGVPGNPAASERQTSERFPGVDGLGSPIAGGTISWLRKSTSKIFKSPNKLIDNSNLQALRDELPETGKQVGAVEPSNRLGSVDNEPQSSFANVDESFDFQMGLSETSTREVEGDREISTDDQSNIGSKASDVPEDSQPSRRGRQHHGRGRPRVSRARSVKAVVQEEKSLLGEAVIAEQLNGNAEGSGFAEKGATKKPQKRSRARSSQITFSKEDGNDSEGNSESVAASHPRKRLQTQYNLPRPKIGVADANALSNPSKEKTKEVDGGKEKEKEVFYSKADPGSGVASENGGSSHFVQHQTLADHQDDNTDIANTIDHMSISEEVNGTPQGIWKYSNRESHGEGTRTHVPMTLTTMMMMTTGMTRSILVMHQ